MITNASKKHIPQIVEIHRASLPDDFLPRLGSPFLENTFYPAVLDSTQANLLINEEDEMVTGFIIVTLDSGRFLKEVIKNHFWSFTITGLRSSLRSLRQFRDNLEILLSSLFSNDSDPSGEIYIIAVDQNFRGKGIGAKLVEAAEQFLKEKDIPSIKIKTLSSNRNWIRHFIQSGWKKTSTFSLIGNNYTVLDKDL